MAVPVRAAEAIIAAGRRMDARGWVPATAGNLSIRLGPERIAITRSGVHKGRLTAFDVIEVDFSGRSVDPAATPSAETLLHCQLYDIFPDAGAVLHGHSVPATVLSTVEPGSSIRFAGYEILKAFGAPSHEAALELPLFPNDQDIPRLAALVAPHLAGARLGTLIRGHGVYVWAPDMDAAWARLEALEFLLGCELERRRL